MRLAWKRRRRTKRNDPVAAPASFSPPTSLFLGDKINDNDDEGGCRSFPGRTYGRIRSGGRGGGGRGSPAEPPPRGQARSQSPPLGSSRGGCEEPGGQVWRCRGPCSAHFARRAAVKLQGKHNWREDCAYSISGKPARPETAAGGVMLIQRRCQVKVA